MEDGKLRNELTIIQTKIQELHLCWGWQLGTGN